MFLVRPEKAAELVQRSVRLNEAAMVFSKSLCGEKEEERISKLRLELK